MVRRWEAGATATQPLGGTMQSGLAIRRKAAPFTDSLTYSHFDVVLSSVRRFRN